MAVPIAGELTKAQVATAAARLGVISARASYSTYRMMRRHPTIAIGRALAVAPIMVGKWAVESDDDVPEAWDKFIKDEVVNRRGEIVAPAAMGSIDYGYGAFELVWRLDAAGVRLAKVKSLVPDGLQLLAKEETGELIGLRQQNVELGLDKALVISFNVEGTNWYGEPLLENARDPWNWWMECNDGARRYDQKVAGAMYVVKYPLGESPDATGALKDNLELAQTILSALQSSGSVCIPKQVSDVTVGGPEDSQWDISLLADSGGRQPMFRDRLEYLDKLMARAMLIPERAILEGTHGTLAEAEAHEDVALLIAGLSDQHIAAEVNRQVVDPLLRYNFGAAAVGKVRITPAPLSDKTLGFLKEVYRSFLASPNGFLEEYGQIDTDALKDKLGIPKSQEVADAGTPEPIGEVRPGVDAYAPEAAATRDVYRALAD